MSRFDDRAQVKMLVATHKMAPMPLDPMYFPLHVGHVLSKLDLGIATDSTGDNISALNGSFCELTALYWAWKNLQTDAIGLSHYRRFFSGLALGPSGARILSSSEANDLLEHADVVLPHPRNYWIETVRSHYQNAHHPEDLRVTREVLLQHAPAHEQAFEKVFAGKKISLFNMFLMRRECFQDYCAWLFPMLFEIAERLELEGRSPYQRRAVGFLAERLLNVWVVANSKNLQIRHHRVVNVDGENLVVKASGLVARKMSRAARR